MPSLMRATSNSLTAPAGAAASSADTVTPICLPPITPRETRRTVMMISETEFDERMGELVTRVSEVLDGEDLPDCVMVASFVLVASILEMCPDDPERSAQALEHICDHMRRMLAQGPAPRTMQ